MLRGARRLGNGAHTSQVVERAFGEAPASLRPEFHQARPVPQPRIDPDEQARERLEVEKLRLRRLRPAEFTLQSALTMVTGFAILLFWLTATSGLLAGTIGCLFFRLGRD